MQENATQTHETAVDSEDLIESISREVSDMEYASASDHSHKISQLIDELVSQDPDFDIFYEEIRLEGMKLLDADYVRQENYSHVNEKGRIILNNNEESFSRPSGINFLDESAVNLVALKYYTQLKKSGENYQHGKISPFGSRLNSDLNYILLERAQKELRRAELDKAMKEKMESQKAKIHKEVPNIFKSAGLPLNEKISEMLMEPDKMQGNRQGSGYTNLSRELSTYINMPLRNPLDLFDEMEISDMLDEDMDYKMSREEKIDKLKIKEKFAAISEKLTHPSHVLLLNMMRDIVFGSEKNLPSLKIAELGDVEKAGTCTTAEMFYFKWTGIKKLKNFENSNEGYMKIITDQSGSPIMIEKVDMGEKSCLSLVPLKIGKVEIPAGSMLQAIEKENSNPQETSSKEFSKKLTLDDYKGFRFLRISTMSLPPDLREETFGNHYQLQKEAQFVNYDWIEPRHYLELAEDALK